MDKKAELTVITEAKRFIEYIFLITEKSPKNIDFRLLLKYRVY